jgi:MinD superfamily P-loop ATPase
MKELIVISGKGGTGKTSVLASFASLAGKAVTADCDVDAADLHLLLKPEKTRAEDFISGRKASIDDEKCTLCGECLKLCRFDAVKEKADGRGYLIDALSCEGCGLCRLACPVDAIIFEEARCGQWFVSESKYGPMVHARLCPGAGNSGRLVTLVKNEAKKIGEEKGLDLMLVDGPPGTGCPVIASISCASLVLAVTEPTLSGLHDLKRVLELTAHFKIPAAFCINKWDVNSRNTDMMIDTFKNSDVRFIGNIPYDMDVTRAQLKAIPVVEFSNGYASQQIRRIWEEVCRMMDL